MLFRKTVVLSLILACLIPSFAFAKNYDSRKIYEGEFPIDDVVFKAGDQLTGGSNISVELYYVDAEDNQIAEGNGSIKAVTINGEKVNEWKMIGQMGSVVQIGSMYRAAYGFTMMPAYACPDGEGYYLLSTQTYGLYSTNEKDVQDRLVKCVGQVINKEDGLVYVSVAEGLVVALETDENVEINDRVNCKGKMTEAIVYNDVTIPKVHCTLVEIQLYDPLKKDDRGPDVVQMKARLLELGYFGEGAKLTDTYTDACVERIKLFQENNGLPSTGEADSVTLAILYSDTAK